MVLLAALLAAPPPSAAESGAAVPSATAKPEPVIGVAEAPSR
jgi:hypothetical protein